jgi:hypothetical protein
LATTFIPASLDPAGVTPMSLPAGFPGMARAPMFLHPPVLPLRPDRRWDVEGGESRYRRRLAVHGPAVPREPPPLRFLCLQRAVGVVVSNSRGVVVNPFQVDKYPEFGALLPRVRWGRRDGDR